MEIYRIIDKSKIQFDFYTLRFEEGYFDSQIKEMGGIVYYNQPISIYRVNKFEHDFFKFLQLHSEVSHVHVHLNQWSGLFLKAAKKAHICYRIAHSRTALDNLSLVNIIKNLIKVNVTKYSTTNLAVSKKSGEWLFGSNCRFTVIPNGINHNNYVYSVVDREKVRSQFNIKNKKVYIHVGNIKKEKNHKYLINVFCKILLVDTDSVLFLVGADFLHEKIHKYAKRKKAHNNIIFVGATSEVSKYLSASDVFLFPSKYEGFPGAVIEAVSNGLPCIISSKISEEIRVFKNVICLDIHKDNQLRWSTEAIKHCRNSESIENGLNDIICFGFDINNVVKKYEMLYLNDTFLSNDKTI